MLYWSPQMNEDRHKQIIYFREEKSDTREGGWFGQVVNLIAWSSLPPFFCSTSLEFVPSVRCGVDPQAEAMIIG